MWESPILAYRTTLDIFSTLTEAVRVRIRYRVWVPLLVIDIDVLMNGKIILCHNLWIF